MRENPVKIVGDGYLKRKMLIAFAVLILFILASIFIWRYLLSAPEIAGTPEPLRKGLQMNEWVFKNIFSSRNLSEKYSLKDVAPGARVNGLTGLKNTSDTANWLLHVVRSPGDTLKIGLTELRSLPKTEIIFDFKCIEGWSRITHWGGIKFSDFINRYGLVPQSQMKFAGLETPDKEYYVGVDMASMMHPQTLLCYEMNGKPLPVNQGYPLRLIIPVKYGVKHLKRIGTLFFDNKAPRDYWYEQGYDYYCGL